MRNFLKYWLPVIIYAAAIFIFSSISKPPKALTFFPYSDKVLHLIEYAIFGFLMIRALCSGIGTSKSGTTENCAQSYCQRQFSCLKSDKRIMFLRITAIAIVVLYGFTDEIHQYFVPGRDMDAIDLLSDGLGALIGQAFFRK